MSWVKIDDKFPRHPKILRAGPLAGWLHINGLAYCAEYLTDGFIPVQAIPAMVDWSTHGICFLVSESQFTDSFDRPENISLAQVLVETGVWDKIKGGYQIHDYLKYQPSKEQVLAEREAEKQRKAKYREKLTHDNNGRFTLSAPDLSHPVFHALSRRDTDKCPTGPVPVPVPDPLPDPRSRSPEKDQISFSNENDPGLSKNKKGDLGKLAEKVLAELSAARKRVDSNCRILKPTEGSLRNIVARLKAGATLEDCLHVIAVCEAESKTDPEAMQWFNAVSPFLVDNFERKLAADPKRKQAQPRKLTNYTLPGTDFPKETTEVKI